MPGYFNGIFLMGYYWDVGYIGMYLYYIPNNG